MANLFSQSNFPEVEPETLRAGSMWRWKRGLTDYTVSSFSLHYEFRSTSSTAFSITATENSDPNEYIVEVASSTTASYAAGLYYWSARIKRTSDNEFITLYEGQTTVEPDPAGSGYDPRSHAQICLDALEAVMERRATTDQLSMSIDGRSISRMDNDSLRRHVNYYRRLVKQERQQQRIANGQHTGNTVYVRF